MNATFFKYLQTQPLFPELYIKLLSLMNINNADDFFHLPKQHRKLTYMFGMFVHSQEDVILRSLCTSKDISLFATHVEEVLEKGREAYDSYLSELE